MDDYRKIYFAVKAFIIHDTNFLAMHKSKVNADWWELPGGRMEFGETAEETLAREIFEETGLIVEPIRILDTWNVIKPEYQITGIIYLCKVEKRDVALSKEHDQYTWLPIHKKSIDKMHNAFKEKMKNWKWDELI